MASSVSDQTFRNVLSNDLLFNIFSKFSFEQKIRAAQVCESWENVIYHQQMWRNIKIRFDGDITRTNEQYMDIIVPSLVQRNITHVKMDILGTFDKDMKQVIFMKKMLENMTSLKAVDLQIDNIYRYKSEFLSYDLPNLVEARLAGNGVSQVLQSFVHHCCNIEVLILTGSRTFSSNNWETIQIHVLPMPTIPQLNNAGCFLKNLTKLQHLECSFSLCNIADVDIGYITGYLPLSTSHNINAHPQLETLVLRSCEVSDKALKYISSEFHSLRHFELESDDITDKGIGYLADMKSLRDLLLLSCAKLTDECCKLLSNASLTITRLKLESCYFQFGNNALKYIGQGQLPLEELDLSYWDITDDGIEQLVSHGQNITRLTLTCCSQITDKSLEMIVEKFPSLRYIDVSGCESMTKEGIRNMIKVRRNIKVESSYTFRNITDL